MICYRDMTFCPYWALCKDSCECERPLTGSVKRAAAEWWGGDDAPICVYSEFPECFRPVFEVDT